MMKDVTAAAQVYFWLENCDSTSYNLTAKAEPAIQFRQNFALTDSQCHCCSSWSGKFPDISLSEASTRSDLHIRPPTLLDHVVLCSLILNVHDWQSRTVRCSRRVVMKRGRNRCKKPLKASKEEDKMPSCFSQRAAWTLWTWESR